MIRNGHFETSDILRPVDWKALKSHLKGQAVLDGEDEGTALLRQVRNCLPQNRA